MTKSIFFGKMIYPEGLIKASPVNVFHRQLEEYTPEGSIGENLHILYRKKFFITETEKTVIRITADDYYKLYINGNYVGQGPCPGFHFNYYYNEYDITDYLKNGENTLAIHGYYQGLINRVWVSGDNRVGVIFDILQGDKLVAESDETVKSRLHDGYTVLGEVGYRTQFMERYDSGCKCAGFEKEDYDDSDWKCALVNTESDHTFVPQPTKNLETETIKPAVVKRDGNTIFVDFGSTYVGYLSLSAKGSKGDKVTIRFGQELSENGGVQHVVRALSTYDLKIGEDGKMKYTLSKKGIYEEEWVLSGGIDYLDEFDYKSFRYVSIILPDGAEIEDIALISRHYPFTLVAKCKYEEEDLKKIWDLCVNSLHYGVQDNIQDCMEREKGQYLGDGSFTSLALAVLTGDTSIMEKLMDDALRTQFINDGLITCLPCSFMQEIAEYPLLLPHLAHSHYVLTGNRDYLEGNFDKIKKMVDYYINEYSMEDGLIGNLDKWSVVDWPHEARDGYDYDLSEGQVSVGTHNVINAYLYGAMERVNRLAEICEKDKIYDTESFKKAYLNAFYDEEQKLFCDTPLSRHTALASNALALAFDLCPEEALENVVEMIMKKNAENSAFFVTFASLYSLKRLGREKEIKEFMSNPGRWLRMISEGATVTFEAWGKDAKWNTSLFHLCYAYGVIYMTEWGMEKLF